jgi:hypothetical protein
LNVDTPNIFDFHDDVDGDKKVNLVLALLSEDAICEAAVLGWHSELGEVAFILSTVESLFTHTNKICLFNVKLSEMFAY